MSTNEKVSNLLIGLIALTALLFAIVSNSAVPTQGVQAESINPVHGTVQYASPTIVPTTHYYPMDTTIVRPNIAAHSARPDACRTWVIGGYDATDGIPCGTSVEKQHKDKDNPVITTVVTPPVVIISTPPPSVVIVVNNTCNKANPGNKKCKGNAGEDPNGKGTMPLDSTDGNGQHGNQGQGGHGKGKDK